MCVYVVVMILAVSAQIDLFVVEQPTGVRVNGLHKSAHTLRIHVWVQTVAEVGDVAPSAERLHHRLYNIRNALLKKTTHKQLGYHLCRFYCAFLSTCLVLIC